MRHAVWRFGTAVSVGATIFIAACADEGGWPAVPPPAGPPPGVTAMDAAPRKVHLRHDVALGTRFQVEARLWTGPDWGRRLIPEVWGYAPTWAVDQVWLSVDSTAGHRVWLKVIGDPPEGASATVTATVAAMTTNPAATVFVEGAVADAGDDRVRVFYEVDAPPAIALINGMRPDGPNLTCAVDELAALVRVADLTNLTANCPDITDADGNVALFESRRRMVLHNTTWTTPLNDVDGAPLQGVRRQLPIAVWVALDGRNLDPMADLDSLRSFALVASLLDKGEANAILARGRAGIMLRVQNGFPRRIDDQPSIDALGSDCAAADALVGNREPGMLNVYYLDDLGGTLRGFMCPRNAGRAEDVIYVSWAARSTTTLAHEVGHSLSLLFPRDGHTEGLPGFDVTNLMASFNDDFDARNRDRLSLGQAFRLNVDEASWLNLATDGGVPVREPSAPRRPCQCDLNARRPCPSLMEDVAPLLTTGGSYDAWMCADEVYLGATSGAHVGVGLVAGRRWRSAFGACDADVPGTLHRRWGAQLRLLFENLDAPPGCPSWLAVFFENHQVLYADPPAPWTYGRDDQPVGDVPGERFTTPVHVWYVDGPSVAALKALGTADFGQAAIAFGPTNRTGISLTQHDHVTPDVTGGGCVPIERTDNAVNVYYVPTTHPRHATIGTKDGVWCSNGTTDAIFISTDVVTHSPTGLSHYLGRALGLMDVDGSGGFEPNNVMWKAPNDGRSELTLGQVFRLNFQAGSWLNRSPISPRKDATLYPRLDCDGADAGKCPGPLAVVP